MEESNRSNHQSSIINHHQCQMLNQCSMHMKYAGQNAQEQFFCNNLTKEIFGNSSVSCGFVLLFAVLLRALAVCAFLLMLMFMNEILYTPEFFEQRTQCQMLRERRLLLLN
jgi:hypothetical protein